MYLLPVWIRYELVQEAAKRDSIVAAGVVDREKNNDSIYAHDYPI